MKPKHPTYSLPVLPVQPSCSKAGFTFEDYILNSFPRRSDRSQLSRSVSNSCRFSARSLTVGVCSGARWRRVSVSVEFALVWRLSLGGARWAGEAEGQSAAGAAVVVSLLVSREREERGLRWDRNTYKESVMLYCTISLCWRSLGLQLTVIFNIKQSFFWVII